MKIHFSKRCFRLADLLLKVIECFNSLAPPELYKNRMKHCVALLSTLVTFLCTLKGWRLMGGKVHLRPDKSSKIHLLFKEKSRGG